MMREIKLTKIAGLILLTAFCARAVEDRKVLVVNKGIGGHATADGLKRFQTDVVDVAPDWLVLYFGMNDSHNPNRRVEPKVFRKNMQVMIDKATAEGIKDIILVTPNPVHHETLLQRVGDHPGREDLNAYLMKFDAIVRDLARVNDLQVVDLRALCKDFGGGNDVKESLVRVPSNGGKGDGVHLTAEGYQKFAKLFVCLFKGRVKSGDVVVCFGDSLTYGAHMEGAGTIFGDTYPAWLSLYLNQLVGVSNQSKPSAPMKITSSPKNGDMEICSDRVRPDFWSVWNIKGRQEGNSRIVFGTGDGGNALKVSNENLKFPATVMSHDMVDMKPGKKWSFGFNYKGGGQIRPVITFYAVGNKSLGSYPLTEKVNPWRQGAGEWQWDKLDLEVPEAAVKMRASFRVKGEVLIDEVRFTAGKL